MEKIVLVMCLIAGFLWIRSRARKVPLEQRKNRAILGVFLLLPGLILVEKYLIEHFNFAPWTDALLKSAFILATFAAIGYACLKPAPARTDAAPVPEAAER